MPPGNYQLVVVPGKPVAMARARVRRGQGGYLLPKTKEALAQWELHLAPLRGYYAEGDIGCALTFFTSTRNRGDIDNLAKLPMDAAQRAGVIKNDRQITDLHAVVRYCSKGDERTRMVLYHVGVPRPGSTTVTAPQ